LGAAEQRGRGWLMLGAAELHDGNVALSTPFIMLFLSAGNSAGKK